MWDRTGSVDYWEYFGNENTGGIFEENDYCPIYFAFAGIDKDLQGSDCRLADTFGYTKDVSE